MKKLLIVAMMLGGCGPDETYEDRRTLRDPNEEMRRQIMLLQQEIQSLVESNYATCSASLSQAAQNICKIAQAATVEARTEMQGALADLSAQLEAKIRDTQVDVATMSGMWRQIYGVDFPETTGAPTPTEAECTTFTGNASVMECVKVQGSAIDALQAAVDALTNSVDDAATQIAIGEENISAGPVYEYILRMGDQARINAYADGLQEALVLGSNPLTAAGGSPSLTINAVNHGLAVGNFIRMAGCQSGKGLTALHLNGQFEVVTVPTANSFTITLSKNASNGGAFGGNTCEINRYTGNGFATIWTSSDPSDSAVRKTTSGSRAYHFAICKTVSNLGKVCYDKTNRIASFATISAGWSSCAGSGNIVCK